MRERLEYKKRRDSAILNPLECVSLIVDGADQSAYGLPKFVVKTKVDRGHAIKVRLVGVLQHSVPNKLRLFTMTEEHRTGANHIIESIHLSLTDILSEQGRLSRKLFLQFDNCTRENKNRFLFSYVESLVQLEVFDDIIVGFLPVGHTHEDIDQSFSVTSARLKSKDIITLSGMQAELRKAYNNTTKVKHLKSVGNWSRLCEIEKCLTNIQLFSQFRYFRFHKDPNVDGDKSTRCKVKHLSTDEWMPLDRRDHSKSFIKFVPQISKMPPTTLHPPPGVEKIHERLQSVEGRINNRVMIRELRDLVDHVYTKRIDPYKWDTDRCVELKFVNGRLRRQEVVATHHAGATAEPSPPLGNTGETDVEQSSNDYTYELDSFVAVNTEDADTDGVWIAQIRSVKRTLIAESQSCELEVHWFEPITNNTEFLAAKFNPAYLRSKTTGQHRPWCDKIPDSSVIVNFPSLTKAKTIPLAARRQIRNK